MNCKCALLISVLGFSCGGVIPQGSAHFDSDQPFVPGAALTFDATSTGGTQIRGVFITDIETNCDDIKARGSLPYVQEAMLAVLGSASITGSTSQIDAGDYFVREDELNAQDPQHLRVAVVKPVPASDTERATDGMVSLTAATEDQLDGTLSLTFSDGRTVAGSFSAPACHGFNPQQ